MIRALCAHFVMAGLVPAIHVFIDAKKKGVDARDKPGHDEVRDKKKARAKRAFELSADRERSGSLVVDLGEVVLGSLRAVGDELAEIFGGRLRPRDEHFAA